MKTQQTSSQPSQEIPAPYRGIVDSIHRSMLEHPEWYESTIQKMDEESNEEVEYEPSF